MILSINGSLKIDKNTTGNQALFHVSLNSFGNVNNRGFAQRPFCMAGTIDSFSHGNKCSF